MAPRFHFATALALAGAVVLTGTAWADPPPWAPAHGWREKHHREGGEVVIVQPAPVYVVPAPMYVQPAPAYVAPYGIAGGTCDRGLVSKELGGPLIGGVAGGLAGSQFGKGGGHIAATAAGVALGALVGSAVGRSMDEVDQHCVGRVLEYAPDRRSVQWTGQSGGYNVTPVRSWQQDGRYCREYQTAAAVNGQWQQVHGTACRQPDGAWQIVN